MRILALRGENLASLADPFEIDFDAPPLKDAGVFAICGPTGAGKSTLLDALCLALYHRTPRLDDGPTATLADIAGDPLQARDPRQWLRRGAGSGFAEVDFVGMDGQRWRARWSVKRARSRVDGKLQAAEASLVALDTGQRHGRTISEVREAIVAVVGLDFAQFTRAVLLAQNQFARFLSADANQRAELLEALTGSQLYSQLSRAAFERARESQNALSVLERSLQARPPLAEQALTELQTQLAASAAAEATLQQQLQPVREGLDWWARHATLVTDAQHSAQAATDARNAQQARADDAAQLEDWLLAQQVRLQLDTELQAQQLLQQRGQAQHLAQAQQQTALHTLQVAQTALAAAQVEAQQCRDSLLQARPLLQQARALDQELALAHAADQAAQQQHTAQELKVAIIRDQLVKIESDLAGVNHQLLVLNDWRAVHSSDQTLEAHWPRLHLLLQQQLELRSQLSKSTAQHDDLKVRLETSSGRLDTAQRARDSANASLQVAIAQQQSSRCRLAELNSGHLQQAVQQHNQALQQLAQASFALQHWQRCSSAHDAATKELHELQTRQEQLRQSSARQQTQLPEREVQARTTQQLWLAARASADQHTEVLRSHLQSGQPCAVCGALDHPYAQHPPTPDPALTQVLRQLELASEAGARDLASHRDAISREQASLEHCSAQLSSVADTVLRARQHAELALQELRAHWPLGDLTASPDAQRLHAELLRHDEQLQQHAASLAQQQQDLQSAADADQQAQQTLATAMASRDQAECDYKDIASQHELVVASAQRMQIEASHLDSRLHQSAVELAAQPGWPVELNARGANDELVVMLQQRVQQWRAQTEQQTRLQRTLEQLNADGARLQAQQQTELLPELQRLTQLAQTSAEALQACTAARRALNEQADTNRWQQSLELALDVAQTTLNSCQLGHIRLTGELAVAEQQLARASQSSQDALQQQSTASSAVDDWLSAQRAQRPALNRQQLRDWLAVPTAQVQQRQSEFAQLAQRITTTEAAANEAQRRLHDWQQNAALHPDQPALQQAEQQLQQQLRELHQQRGGLIEQLDADQRLRQQHHALLEQLAAAQQQHHTWAQLSELIGSADGAKFRRLAQQYTLDAVLAYTNVHLHEFSPRYQLRREQDNLLVVDAHLGDAIRAVSSLSGGETFLVSLALALGLASMTAQRLRIESLFIDEGFGALDEHSLRLALEALDKLQAQGRKVGVISHLPELTERIATRIEVKRVGHGASTVQVRG